MSETIELRPCPFCGGHKFHTGGDDEYRQYWVECNRCEIVCESEYSVDDAIARWNRRAAPPPDERRAADDGWIAVGERLPELNKDDASAHVLVYTKRGQFAAYRTEGEWYVSLYDDEVAIEVTHWQPLPPPPGSDEPAPTAPATDERELLGEALIEWAADGEKALSQDEHNAWCVFCGVPRQFNPKPHKVNCLHKRAQTLRGKKNDVGDNQ